jgi:flagellar biogenesis protein FliO
MQRACLVLVAALWPWLSAAGVHAQYEFDSRDDRGAFFQESLSESNSRFAEPVREFAPADNAETGESRRISRPGEPAAANERGEQPRRPGSFWQTLGPLALIVVVIVLAARVWKKHGPRINAGVPAEALEVLGRRHLDARQTIHLVRLGSRILVLGSSPAGLRTLAEITDPVEVDSLAGLCRRTDDEPGIAATFRSLFQKQSPADEESPREEAAARPTGEQQFAERLKQLAAARPRPETEDVHAA